MTDYFALLNESRRPGLDTEALKARFLVLSTEQHPDRIQSGSENDRSAAQRNFAVLNAAYQCLREPRDRLQHLLELESGVKPKAIDRVPAGTMDLFLQVGQLCRDVDAFLAERTKAASPLLRVQFFERGMECTDRLNLLQQRINASREDLMAVLEELNRVWDHAPAVGDPNRAAKLPLGRLEQIYRDLSYLTRWTAQIQERIVQLSL